MISNSPHLSKGFLTNSPYFKKIAQRQLVKIFIFCYSP